MTPSPSDELFRTDIQSYRADGGINHAETAEIVGLRTAAALRIVLDPQGEDHDILIEQHGTEWRVYIHPRGGDPLCIARLGFQQSSLENDVGETLIVQDF